MRVRDPKKRNDESGVLEEKHNWRSSKAVAKAPPPPRVPAAAAPVKPYFPPAPAPGPEKKKVLFVCIGNACRSQMAEAFTLRYGADIVDVSSAGLSPATSGLPELTKAVMKDKGISLDGHYSKGPELFQNTNWDVLVNISGNPLGALKGTKVLEWKVEDPMGQRQVVHERVRDEIEDLVMRLILEIRTQSRRP